MARVPKGYDGNRPTFRSIKRLLPNILKDVSSKVDDEPLKVLTLWSEVVGKEIGKRAIATQFESGILTVRVSDSTLLSLLARQEKYRLMKELQKRLGKGKIKDIFFRIG